MKVSKKSSAQKRKPRSVVQMGVTECKQDFPRLLEIAKSKDICITRYGQPVAFAVSPERLRALNCLS